MLRGVVNRSAKAAWTSSNKHPVFIAHQLLQFSTEMTVDEPPKDVKPRKYVRKTPLKESSPLEVPKTILSSNCSDTYPANATLSQGKLYKSKDKAIKLVKEARKNGAKLEFAEYLQGFSACVKTKELWAIELSFYIFQQMINNQDKVPIEVFEQLAIRIRHHDQLLAIDHAFRSLGHRPTEIFIKHMLTSISEAQSSSPALQKILLEYYELYLVMQRARPSFRLDATIYIAISTYFCNMHDTTTSLRVLQNMVDVHYEITVKRCERLFTTALVRRETAVLRVLSRIYLDKVLPTSAMDLGDLRRLMQIACALGDDQLALLGFQLLQRSGIQPAIMDYFCLVQSMLKSHDLISAVELLQEMQDNGFTLDTREDYAGLYHDVLVQIMNIFRKGGVKSTPDEHDKTDSEDGDYYSNQSHEDSSSSSTSPSTSSSALHARSKRRKFISDFYLALVDQAQHTDSKPVPRIILDAILLIMAEDSITTRDQTMKIFENYSAVFRQNPSPMSYVAYLKTIVHRRKMLSTDQEDMFNVFQDFESRFMSCPKVEFNQDIVNFAMSKCYDLLYSSMLNKRNDFDIFEDIWNHMLSEHDKVLPSLSISRRLLIHFTQVNDEEKAGLVLTALEKLYYDKYKLDALPKHLMDKLQTFIEANLGLEPIEEQSTDSSQDTVAAVINEEVKTERSDRQQSSIDDEINAVRESISIIEGSRKTYV